MHLLYSKTAFKVFQLYVYNDDIILYLSQDLLYKLIYFNHVNQIVHLNLKSIGNGNVIFKRVTSRV